MVIASVGTAEAAFYTSASAFAAANPGLPTLTFEGIAPAGGYVMAPSFVAQGVTFSSSVMNDVYIGSKSFLGSPSDVLFANTLGNTLKIDFSSPATAVGFNLSAALNGGVITVSAYDGSSLIGTKSVTTANPTAFTTYFGVSGIGPITEITLTPTNANRAVVIDNLSFDGAMSVPEPSSAVLCTIGVAACLGLGLSRHRAGPTFSA